MIPLTEDEVLRSPDEITLYALKQGIRASYDAPHIRLLHENALSIIDRSNRDELWKTTQRNEILGMVRNALLQAEGGNATPGLTAEEIARATTRPGPVVSGRLPDDTGGALNASQIARYTVLPGKRVAKK